MTKSTWSALWLALTIAFVPVCIGCGGSSDPAVVETEELAEDVAAEEQMEEEYDSAEYGKDMGN